MDWLLNLAGHVSDGMFAFAVVMIVLALVAAIWMLIGAKGNVTIGPDPQPQRVIEPPRYALPPAPILPNYVREFVADVDETAAATVEIVDDLADTVEFKAIEVEVVEDPSLSPIFYQIKRPPPGPDLETFTQGWTRERLERIKEGRP